MNKNRLTLEELKELKPSFDNPIKIVCDDGNYTSAMKVIKVVGFYGGRVFFINGNDSIDKCNIDFLRHYPSFKKEREKMEFKPYWVDGALYLLNKDFANVVVSRGEVVLSGSFSPERFDITPAKGIESVWRYIDDWSVCE